MNTRRYALPALTATVALATMLALTSCSGGGSFVNQLESAVPSSQAALDSGGPTDAGAPSGAGAAGDADPATSTAPAAPTVKMVDKSVEYAGMMITVETATLQPAAQQYAPTTVKVDMLFKNLGDMNGTLSPTGALDLTSGSNDYSADDADLPDVPGGAQNHGSATFTVDEAFSLDDAVLTIGTGDTVQSVVPFGATGTLVANTPQKVALAGTVSSGIMSVKVTGGQVTTDLPKAFTQSEKDKRFLFVDFDVTNTSTLEHPYGDLVTGGSQFTLTEPNGDTVMAYDLDDFYGGAPTTTVIPGATGHHLLVVFVIDAPVSGNYTLQLTGPKDDNSGDNAPTAKLPLTLP